MATEALAWSVRGTAPNRLQREFRANVNFLRVPWDRRSLSIDEAALQLKVTLRNLFIDQ